ncbi:zinc ribbon domain-containing protein [Calditrichota bacterium]
MPTYTYKCQECGLVYDLFHSISDSSEKLCPECESLSERFYESCASFTVKGSGLSAIPQPTRAHTGFS